MHRPRAVALASAAASALALFASRASAQIPEGPEPTWEKAPATRRSGFTAGFAGGGALGMASGYPNDAKKIGRASAYTESGLGLGGAGAFWVGGALSDWLTFAVGLGGNILAPSEGDEQEVAILFRIEAYPMFWRGGFWRDLGLGFDVGTGSATLTGPDDPDTKLIDGGAPSRVGVAAFYEGLRLWKIATGPFIGTSYVWSETIRRGEGVIGWRTAIYTGP